MRWLFDPDSPRVMLWEGDIRSTKTYGAVMLLLTHSLARQDQFYILQGVSRPTIERNVITKFRELAPAYGFDLPRWEHKTQSYRCGENSFVLAGAPTERAAFPIPGMSAAGMLADELTLLDRANVDYAISRCDQPDSIVLGTFNPDHPSNWVKHDWLDGNEVEHTHLVARLQDAVDAGIIDPSVPGFYRSTLSGHRAKRWLEGEWAAPSGLCVPSCRPVEVLGGPYRVVEAGVDWGTSNATAAEYWGLTDSGAWESAGEYYFDSAEQGFSRTAGEHAAAIISLGNALGCRAYVIDPSAAPLKIEMQDRGADVWQGVNDVLPGIDAMETAFADGSMRANENAPMLCREASAYRWDENALEDRPVKKFDHAMDATRYFTMRHFAPAPAAIHFRRR